MKTIKSKTNRGFKLIEFNDQYDTACSMQKSSLATEDAIWLGVHEANPKIMASDAKAAGIQTEQQTGWIAYPIPKQVLISTRMHLTREQVKSLLPILQRFVEKGDLW